MSEKLSSNEGGSDLDKLQEELHRLRQEERQVKEQIARLQAEVSRSTARDRQRAQLARSATIPSLQLESRRLRAEIFRLEQEVRAVREHLEHRG